MKRKLFVGIMLTLFLVIMTFNAIPVKASPGWDGEIKIGCFGPMPWIQGQGIAEGCRLAADQINRGPDGVDNAGDGDDGIVVGGLNYKAVIVAADDLRGMPDPTGATGTAAAMELKAAGCKFAVGGFRTESVMGAREVFMDYSMIYIIAGAATNELVDCNALGWTVSPTGTLIQLPACGKCVRCNYARYKYTFRSTPINSTQLFRSIGGMVKYTILKKLVPLFGTAIKVAVISEALTWADVMHAYLTSPTYYTHPLLLNITAPVTVSVVYAARVSPVATDVSAELASVKASGAHIVIPVLSGPVGRTFIKQWKDMGVRAIPVGIDVPGQEIPLHWTATGGKCEYEVFLATAGSAPCPMTFRTVDFQNAYIARYGHAPIYTSYGAYDAVIGIEQLIEGRGLLTNEALIPYMEYVVRDGTGAATPVNAYHYKWPLGAAVMLPNIGLVGKFKYTGGTSPANATGRGGKHDVFMDPTVHPVYGSLSLGPFWGPVVTGWVRAINGQWQYNTLEKEARLEVVYPYDQAFSTKFKIAPWAYTSDPTKYSMAETDFDSSRSIGSGDLTLVTYAWLSKWPSSAWLVYGLTCDMDYDKVITIADVSAMAKDWGKSAPP